MFNFICLPFIENDFMHTALVTCWMLSLSIAPLGVFLSFKRMSLTGDALGHALLPGAALGYMVAGLSMLAMTVGGLLTGLLLAAFSSLLSHRKKSTSDSNLAALYLISLSLGVVLVSLKGTQMDLMHFLFGHILAIDAQTKQMIAAVVIISCFVLIRLYRALLLQVIDPNWARFQKIPLRWIEFLFLFLVVLNLVVSFQALGTLMSVGLMILPGITARLWTNSMKTLIFLSILIAGLGTFLGLLGSFYGNLPSGPTIILTLGVIYLISFLRTSWSNS